MLSPRLSMPPRSDALRPLLDSTDAGARPDRLVSRPAASPADARFGLSD